MKTTIKPLSKVNQKISDLASQILDIESYNTNDDFNTREGSICANIKVYEWLDQDDINKVISDRNLESAKDEIIEEFNEDRLNSIHNHVCEIEVDYLKEKYEQNVDLDNPYLEYNLYKRYFESDFKSFPLTYKSIRDKNNVLVKEWLNTNKSLYKSFTEFSKRKNNNPEYYLNYLRELNEWEFKEWDKRSLINFECWQYGRSGGWFSICKESELEGEEFESYDFYTPVEELEGIEDNKEFNRILNEEFDVNYTTKKQLINEMETFIDNWNEKKEAIEYFVEKIEEDKKYFKESLTEKLSTEIEEFVNDLNIEFSNCKIKIEDAKIKTTLGVSVDLKEFKTAFNKVKGIFSKLEVNEKKPIKLNVGGYFVEYAKRVETDILIKAGCHKFSLNNINKVLN